MRDGFFVRQVQVSGQREPQYDLPLSSRDLRGTPILTRSFVEYLECRSNTTSIQSADSGISAERTPTNHGKVIEFGYHTQAKTLPGSLSRHHQ